jgi:hypothetical protein
MDLSIARINSYGNQSGFSLICLLLENISCIIYGSTSINQINQTHIFLPQLTGKFAYFGSNLVTNITMYRNILYFNEQISTTTAFYIHYTWLFKYR